MDTDYSSPHTAKVRVMILRFKNELRREEIGSFRGAIVAQLTDGGDVLFHNHKDGGFRFSYPLIQYKRLNQRAVIVCLEKGCDVIGELFRAAPESLRIGKREMQPELETVNPHTTIVQLWESMFRYSLRRWLALNKENYEVYQQLNSLVERVSFLERILIGNLLSFTKGIGLFLNKEVHCRILSMEEPKTELYKGVRLMMFDVVFECNLSIPDYIGIGKGASLNHGIVSRRSIEEIRKSRER